MKLSGSPVRRAHAGREGSVAHTANATRFDSGLMKERGMEQIPWRPVDLDAACNEAKTANKLVLVDFFSPM